MIESKILLSRTWAADLAVKTALLLYRKESHKNINTRKWDHWTPFEGRVPTAFKEQPVLPLLCNL